MQTAKFIADRIKFNGKDSFSAFVIRICQGGIVIGVAVLLVAVAILHGFEQAIEQKLYSFEGHVQLTSYLDNESVEPKPLPHGQTFKALLKGAVPQGKWQAFVRKPAIARTREDVQGLLLKGIGSDFQTNQFAANMVAGRMPRFAFDTSETRKDSVVISQKLAKLLKLDIDSTLVLYFLQNPPRARKMIVAGIYNTSMEEFDQSYCLCSRQTLAELNQWGDTLVSGYELFLPDAGTAEQVASQVNQNIQGLYQARSAEQMHPQIFDWLRMIERNVDILLVLISVVAGFNIISTLLIMVLERIPMIGVLQAIGATQGLVMGVFRHTGARILLWGMLWGNVTGLVLCMLQWQFKLIPLDPENYYMNFVPIAWNLTGFLTVNVFVFSTGFLGVVLPLRVVRSIKTIQALKAD